MAKEIISAEQQLKERKQSESMDKLIDALNKNTKVSKDASGDGSGGRKNFGAAAVGVAGSRGLSALMGPIKRVMDPFTKPIQEFYKDVEKARGVEEIEKDATSPLKRSGENENVTATKEGGDSYSLLQQISANVDSIKDLMVKGAEADEMAAREKVTDTDFQKDAKKITEGKEKKQREDPESGFNLTGLLAGLGLLLTPLGGIGTALAAIGAALGVSKYLPDLAKMMAKPKSQPKPQAKSATKPATTPQTKPEPKPQPKPQAKPEPKPQTKPATTPQTKPQPKPEPKPQAKPEPKPQPRDAKGRYAKKAPQATRMSNFARKAGGIVSRFGVRGMGVAAAGVGAYKGTEYLLKETEAGKKVTGFMSGLISKIDAGLSDELTDKERVSILNNREDDYKKAQEVLLKDETLSKEDKAKFLKTIQGAQFNMNPGSNDAAIDDKLQNTSDALVKELLKPTALNMSPTATPQTQAVVQDSLLSKDQNKTGDVAVSSTNIDTSSSSKQVIINQQPHVPMGF